MLLGTADCFQDVYASEGHDWSVPRFAENDLLKGYDHVPLH